MRPDERPRNRGRAYQRLRRRILDRQGWRCGDCQRAGRLELHHRDHDRTNDDPANLIGLCRPCHFGAHRRGPGPNREPWRAELRRRQSAPVIIVRYGP